MITLHRGLLSDATQRELLEAIRAVVRDAPLFTPSMPRAGTPFRYQMTNCGALGWVADKRGFRYTDRQADGRPWPAIPATLDALARSLGGADFEPQSCLVNVYRAGETLGWHQDRTEERFDRPIVSISLGDTGEFLIAGVDKRPGRTERAGDSYLLATGDALVFGGEDRMRFHTFAGIRATHPLLRGGGRINLTIRQVR